MNTTSINPSPSQAPSTPPLGVPSSVDDSVSNPEPGETQFPPWATAYLEALGHRALKADSIFTAPSFLYKVVELRRRDPAFRAAEQLRLDAQPEFLESEAFRRTITQLTFDA